MASGKRRSGDREIGMATALKGTEKIALAEGASRDLNVRSTWAQRRAAIGKCTRTGQGEEAKKTKPMIHEAKRIAVESRDRNEEKK